MRDAERQKMSKTKGNVIDPLVVNEKYGTDAVRFGLLVAAAPGNDIALSEEVILRGRNFANKIWNASRLLFTQGAGRAGARVAGGPVDRKPVERGDSEGERGVRESSLSRGRGCVVDFFLGRVLRLVSGVEEAGYRIGASRIRCMRKRCWLCIRLMPFITEELWHRRGHETSIALEAYPQVDPALDDPEAEREMKSAPRNR